MPHYKDGTPAQVGDLVKGNTYNKQDSQIGVLIEIKPGTTCNAVIALAPLDVMQIGSSNYLLSPRMLQMGYAQCDHLEKL